MLINLQEIFEIAEKENYGIAAFNVPTFENLAAALNVAERYNKPIIIQHAQVHEGVMPLELIGPAMVALAKKSSVPICVHLDHGEDIDHIKRALELGFTSVMYDGSSLPFEENVKNTREVVKLAQKYNAGVEAEIGMMGGEEGDKSQTAGFNEDFYTDPSEAIEFVEQTQITGLAASFGTVHGFYASEPKLDYDRLEEIATGAKLPIVMHGGSGLTEKEYKRVIELGVRKINYYSYNARVGLDKAIEVIDKHSPQLYHEVATEVIKAMTEDYAKIIEIFYHL